MIRGHHLYNIFSWKFVEAFLVAYCVQTCFRKYVPENNVYCHYLVYHMCPLHQSLLLLIGSFISLVFSLNFVYIPEVILIDIHIYGIIIFPVKF